MGSERGKKKRQNGTNKYIQKHVKIHYQRVKDLNKMQTQHTTNAHAKPLERGKETE